MAGYYIAAEQHIEIIHKRAGNFGYVHVHNVAKRKHGGNVYMAVAYVYYVFDIAWNVPAFARGYGYFQAWVIMPGGVRNICKPVYMQIHQQLYHAGRGLFGIVDHKHVLVNGKCVNIPSYLVKAGDVIEVKEKAKSSQRYKDALEVTAGRLVPAWLDVDQENLRGTVKELPSRDEIDVPVNEMLIVELYSK